MMGRVEGRVVERVARAMRRLDNRQRRHNPRGPIADAIRSHDVLPIAMLHHPTLGP